MTASELIGTGLISFVVGIFSGFFIQEIKFRKDRKRDKLLRLMPYMEIIHPIFESLMIDIEHAKKLAEKNDSEELNRYHERISKDFESFGIWFVDFAEKGLKIKLESIDLDLLLGLRGLNVFSQMIKNRGVKYIFENINLLSQSLINTEYLLKEFLKS